MNRLQENQHHSIGGQTPAEKEKLAKEVERYKEEAEQVCQATPRKRLRRERCELS